MNPAGALLVVAMAASQLPGVGAPEPERAPARLAFTADERIYTIAADGSGRAPLTADGTAAASPAWSPDGTRLAFAAASGDDEDELAHIRIANADGSGDHAITRATRGVYDSEPAWSPDGRQVVFSRIRLGSRSIVSAIVAVAADGTGERTLLRHVTRRSLSYVHSPAWSPTGDRILFTRTRLDRDAYFRPSLHTIASEGGGEALFARDATGGAWSPDGRRLAFVSVRDRNGDSCGSDECSYNGEIYVSDATGAAARRLTTSEADDANPSWSQDGRWIAFDSDRNYPEGERPEVYVIRDDGSCMTWLTNGTARSGDPSWQPGRSVSADPGVCGAAQRPPLIETDIAPARAARSFPVYWLGESYGGLLLSDVIADRGTVHLAYADCAHYEPAECPQTLELSSSSACSRDADLFLLTYSERLARRRGALVSWSGGEVGMHVFTGRSLVAIPYISERRAAPPALLRVVDSLRTLDQPAAAGDLPRAALPRRLLSTLRRTELLRRRLGSVRAVHRRLGISRSAVRRRLRLARTLRGLGGARALRCRPG